MHRAQRAEDVLQTRVARTTTLLKRCDDVTGQSVLTAASGSISSKPDIEISGASGERTCTFVIQPEDSSSVIRLAFMDHSNFEQCRADSSATCRERVEVFDGSDASNAITTQTVSTLAGCRDEYLVREGEGYSTTHIAQEMSHEPPRCEHATKRAAEVACDRSTHCLAFQCHHAAGGECCFTYAGGAGDASPTQMAEVTLHAARLHIA